MNNEVSRLVYIYSGILLDNNITVVSIVCIL